MGDPRVIAIAHRGASAYAPENTVAAFDEAVRLGALAVEFDVRMTADGVPVCLHDDTLDRTTSGRGPVSECTSFDLLRLDAGSWFHPRFAASRVPTLDEALTAIARYASPIIELKTPLDPAVLLALLKHHEIVEESLVISFDPAALRAVRMHTPDIALGLLGEDFVPPLIADANALDASHLIVPTHALRPGRIADAESAGLEVWAYTANDVGMMAACAALGVTGIITDRPDLIRHRAS